MGNGDRSDRGERIRRWFGDRVARLGLRPAPASPRADGVYPDYVTCPHCGELEVEVWCNEKEARCHNCGKTFEHKAQPECEKES